MKKATPVAGRAGKAGFTLVELLVVIVIVALLAAFLMPALRGARQRAWQAACLNNLRQVGIALNLYTQDNADWLPPARDWDPGDPDELSWAAALVEEGYLTADVLVCPAGDWQTHGSPETGFMYHLYIGDEVDVGTPSRRRVSQALRPSETAIVFDGWTSDLDTTLFDPEIFEPGVTPGDDPQYQVHLRHFYGANILFLDGRVDWSDLGNEEERKLWLLWKEPAGDMAENWPNYWWP